jgi:transposase InsO family protein
LVKHRRCRALSRANADQLLLEKIRVLKSEHPFWGYRRVWAYLRFVAGLSVNRKRVYRLLSENNLLVKADTRLLAKRISKTRKPRPERANHWWGIDMTKVMTDSGWAYVVLVVDWYSKKVVGHYCGEQSKSWHWLAALNKAVNRQFPRGIREAEIELNLMSDNGSQPTSRVFMETCAGLGIKQAFTAYNNPKGNADTERMMRTLKEELCWLREWSSADELKTELDRFVEDFNDSYRHSALGYKTPNAFEQEHFEKQQATLNLAA